MFKVASPYRPSNLLVQRAVARRRCRFGVCTAERIAAATLPPADAVDAISRGSHHQYTCSSSSHLLLAFNIFAATRAAPSPPSSSCDSALLTARRKSFTLNSHLVTGAVLQARRYYHNNNNPQGASLRASFSVPSDAPHQDTAPSLLETQRPVQRFLVYNAFTNRRVYSDSPALSSLEEIGIVPDEQAKHLTLRFPERLVEYARKLQTNEIAPPKAWTSFLHRRLTAKLREHQLSSTATGVSDARESAALAESVNSMLHTMSAIAESRRGVQLDGDGRSSMPVGTVTAAGTNAESASQTSAASTLPQATSETLTSEQERVLELVAKGYHVYLGGGAGTGKTTLLKALRTHLTAKLGLHVATTAVTGIAAVNIQGSTIHHRFGITKEYQFFKRKELKKYDVLIIDEVSMVPLRLFHALDAALRKANGVQLPFGGVQVILCGDFMQLSAISDQPILGSPVFRQHFVMVRLQEVIRQSSVSRFAMQLAEIRRGLAPDDLFETITSSNEPFVENAINLLPTNAQVREANQLQLAKLEGVELHFPSVTLAPQLQGEWTATYTISVPTDIRKLDLEGLRKAVETHVFDGSNMAALVMMSSTMASTMSSALSNQGQRVDGGGFSPAQRLISLYPLFDDAVALRIQIPPSLEQAEKEVLLKQLDSLDEFLKTKFEGLHRVTDVIHSALGLHTADNEHDLHRAAAKFPMTAPLNLKLGCKVLVRTNLSFQIVNGSVGTVVGFRPCDVESISKYLLHSQRDASVAEYASHMKFEHAVPNPVLPVVDFGNGVVETIPPCAFQVGGTADTNFYSTTVLALPLTLAYAFTVHKVQGLTLVGKVHLELSKMWPCNHLLYVAMSRVRDANQLSVSGFDKSLIRAAAECLLFDDSIPFVDAYEIPALALPATWKQFPGKRKMVLLAKAQQRSRRSTAAKKSTETPSTEVVVMER